MKLKYPCALVALFPLSAMAAQPDGLMAGVFTILVLGGFTLVNLLLQLVFYFNGQYSRPGFVRSHIYWALPIPLMTLLLVLWDHASIADLSMNFGLVLIAVALALLPLQLKNSAKVAGPQAGWRLLATSALLLLLANIIWPLTIPAMLIAWSAPDWQQRRENGFKLCRIVLLLAALGLTLYEGFQAWQHFFGA